MFQSKCFRPTHRYSHRLDHPPQGKEYLRHTKGYETVQWAHPDRPVPCEFTNDQGRGLVVERPAFVTQLNNTLKAAARAIGVTVKVTAHNLRRGTAQDTARLATPTGIESAAAVLYHKPGSVVSGVTQRYVGTIGPTDWEKRTGLEDDQDFSLLTNGKRQKLDKPGGVASDITPALRSAAAVSTPISTTSPLRSRDLPPPLRLLTGAPRAFS
ncbi:hypothetical protein D6C85_09829 [Aureobasidium pullulans]|uniref:Uncharacterized protein n=1 Tax=Aureobasidium pullulans TaxID=5580 RepID=A0A4S9W7T9_AURPU|nr:hypothetical protein D6C85_09829 [Aureobasidium pullulans]